MRFDSGIAGRLAGLLVSVAVAVAVAGPIGLTGCRSSADADRPPTAGPVSTKGGGLLRPPTAPSEATNAVPATETVLPASGRVHSLNPGLRFLVADYTLGGMPPLHSRLGVYRNNEKIGEIRLSGPERNGFVAADILEGVLQIGDEIRVQ